MGKFIIAFLICFSSQAQHCDVEYFLNENKVVFDCQGNTSNRILVFADTTVTTIILNQESRFCNYTFKKDFEYESLVIYKSDIECEKFSVQLKYSENTNLKYVYELDPFNPHQCLLKIWDTYAL